MELLNIQQFQHLKLVKVIHFIHRIINNIKVYFVLVDIMEINNQTFYFI